MTLRIWLNSLILQHTMQRRSRLGGVADGAQWFTRTQAKRFLGVALETVKQAQKRGALESVQMQGVTLFSRATLEAYKAGRANPELAQRAFGLLDAGHSAVQLVATLHVSPDVAESLVASYARLNGAWIVAGPTSSRSAWERTYRIGALTPLKLRRALELAARTPSLRARLLSLTEGPKE